MVKSEMKIKVLCVGQTQTKFNWQKSVVALTCQVGFTFDSLMFMNEDDAQYHPVSTIRYDVFQLALHTQKLTFPGNTGSPMYVVTATA